VVIGGGLLALIGVVPRVFTSDPEVIDRARAMWPLFALLWPVAGAVFALDGILIGAGDGRYLAAAMLVALAVFAPLVWAASAWDWGIVGVWVALLVLMAVRGATLGVRFAGERWALLGSGG
jgi:Na+-driven multidrug efflux pump